MSQKLRKEAHATMSLFHTVSIVFHCSVGTRPFFPDQTVRFHGMSGTVLLQRETRGEAKSWTARAIARGLRSKVHINSFSRSKKI